jgi:hypothetical protein
MRLGLALHKSRAEIRELPAPEYREWELFYMIEPWGWQNTEYLASAIMTTLLNLQVKKKDQKKPTHFIRDMAGGILKQLEAQRVQRKEQEKIASMTIEERREYLIPIIMHDMGVIK